MKIVVMTLANDEVCICGRCQKDGRSRSYTPMIEAIRKTWAAQKVEGIKPYYIYCRREGIEFPPDSKLLKRTKHIGPVNRKVRAACRSMSRKNENPSQ